MKRFFSFSADGDLTLHETSDEAELAAETDLIYEQVAASREEWRDEVEQICWVELRERVVKTKSTPTPGSRFDSIDEYELVDVAAKT